MKLVTVTLLGISLFFVSFSDRVADDHVTFVCKRKHMSTNRCHYNFKVDGAKYRFVDIGCKYKKLDEVIKKAKSGDLALAKDWEIECGFEGKEE